MKKLAKTKNGRLVKSATLFMTLFVTALMLCSTVPAAVNKNTSTRVNLTNNITTAKAVKEIVSKAASDGLYPSVGKQNQNGNKDVIWIYYDTGSATNSLGLTAGGSFEVASRFTPTELGPYAGFGLTQVQVYQGDPIYDPNEPGHDINIIVYDQGTDTTPGGILYQQAAATVAGAGFQTFILDTPVPIAGDKDMWVSIDFLNTAAGNYPAGMSPGATVGKGDWLNYGSGWIELSDVGYDYNFMVRGGVESLTHLAHDIKMVSIDSPVTGTCTGAYTPQCTIKNVGNNTETNVPVEMAISTMQLGPVQTILTENMNTWTYLPLDGWTTQILQGAYSWYSNSYTGRGNYAGTGYCADADVDVWDYYPMQTTLTSPSMDLSSYGSATLKWNNYIDVYASDILKAEYSIDGGSTWTAVYTQTGSYIYGQYSAESHDISAACGHSNVKVRFNYYTASWAYYWEVDDVQVLGQSMTLTPVYDAIASCPSIAVGATAAVTFSPTFTPAQWQNPTYQDTYANFIVTATANLATDMDHTNDGKTLTATIYFPFLKDMTVDAIISPTQDGLATTFPVKVRVKNVGQDAVKNFFTEVQIGPVGIDGTKLSADFQDYICPPTGWTDEGSGWYLSYTNYAGGTYPEAILYYYYDYSPQKLYSKPFDTTGVTGAQLQFKLYSYNWYSNEYFHACVSKDNGATWTDVWSQLITATGAQTITVPIPAGYSQERIGFYRSGTYYGCYYFCLDDILVQGTYINAEYDEDQAITSFVYPGQTVNLTYPDWTPAGIAADVSGVFTYGISAQTQLSGDNHPSNDVAGTTFKLTYIHDVLISKVNSPALGKGGEVLFEQAPYGPNDYWNAYTSDSGLGYLVQDNFYGVTKSIGGINWFGLPLIWSSGWSGGYPDGMVFHITFYDTSGNVMYDFPNVDDATFTNIGPYSWAPADAWHWDIPGGVAMTDGWISIQSVSSPSGSVFLWLDSPTGDNNAEQNGGNLGDNTAFNLTAGGHGPPPVTVYVPIGSKPFVIVVSNVGTFPEDNLYAFANLTQYITNPNGSGVSNNSITGINLDPLTGQQTLTFPAGTFGVEGRYGLVYYISCPKDDKTGNNKKTIGIGCDNTPPVSSYTITPTNPDGLNGWYVHDVTVKLSATDPTVADVSSGVAKIEYSIDGGAWTTYSGQFKVTTDSANHIVKYRATDKVGNVEADKTIPSFKVDKTKPTIAMNYTYTKEGSHYNVIITVTATDAMSGMHHVSFYYNGVLEANVSGSGPTFVWNYTYAPLPTVIIKAIAYDVAGNNDFKTIENPTNDLNLNQQAAQQLKTNINTILMQK